MPRYKHPPALILVLGVGLVAFVLGGCQERSSAPTEAAPDLDVGHIATVTRGAAREALQGDGVFALRDDVPETGISAEAARIHALAYARTFGPYQRRYLELQHGGAIDFDGLAADKRVFKAQSTYDVQTNVAPVERRYGPYYLVQLTTEDDRPVLSAAVSALNLDVTISSDGRFLLPDTSGFEVMLQGLAAGEAIVTPEEAALLTAAVLDAYVIEVPHLIVRPGRYWPNLAVWRIDLDRSVTVTGAHGVRRQTSEIFVTHDRQLAVGSGMPAESWHAPPSRPGVQLTKRPGLPSFLEAVTVAR